MTTIGVVVGLVGTAGWLDGHADLVASCEACPQHGRRLAVRCHDSRPAEVAEPPGVITQS